MGFLIQFLEVFSELKGNNLWLSGESVSQAQTVITDDYLLIII